MLFPSAGDSFLMKSHVRDTRKVMLLLLGPRPRFRDGPRFLRGAAARGQAQACLARSAAGRS